MFERGTKLIGAIVGLTTVGTGIVAGILWLGRRADAGEVAARFAVNDRRLERVEVKQDNETEWRRWMVTQVERISRRVGATVAPPPVIEPAPMGPLPKDAP